MQNFSNILQLSKTLPKANMGVINPVDSASLQGALDSLQQGLTAPTLFGNQQAIQNCANSLGSNYTNLLQQCNVVNSNSLAETLANSMQAVKSNSINALMKGSLHTDEFMGAIVKRENGLRTENHISHLFALQVPAYNKLLFIADGGINILPTLEQKVKIIQNSIKFLHKIGIQQPNVGLLSATESVLPKMLSSAEANEITLNNYFGNTANVFGPLAFDNLISTQAAKIKGITNPIAGNVDLIIAPNIETGNSLTKALVYFANATVAGIVLGTKMPIVLTSRADNAKARVLSCAMANIAKDII